MKHTTGTLLLRKTICTLSIVAAVTAAQAQAGFYTSAHVHKGLYPKAAGTFRADMVQVSPDAPRFRLRFSNPAGEKVVVAITDAHANQLFTRTFNDVDYMQTYDLTQLADGTYTFTLTKGREVIKKTVRLHTGYEVVKKVSIL